MENLEIKVPTFGNVEEEIKVMRDNLRGALEEMGEGKETIQRGENTVSGIEV